MSATNADHPELPVHRFLFRICNKKKCEVFGSAKNKGECEMNAMLSAICGSSGHGPHEPVHTTKTGLNKDVFQRMDCTHPRKTARIK
jgi:hypothetical protein